MGECRQPLSAINSSEYRQWAFTFSFLSIFYGVAMAPLANAHTQYRSSRLTWRLPRAHLDESGLYAIRPLHRSHQLQLIETYCPRSPKTMYIDVLLASCLTILPTAISGSSDTTALAAPTYVAQHHGTVTSQAATSAPGLLPRALHMANVLAQGTGHAQIRHRRCF